MSDAPAPAPVRVYLDAELRPHRSLSRTGFLVLMGVVAAANVAVGAYYVSLGAWPIPVFLGLDVLLVWIAFRASYRQARLVESVRVTADRLDVVRRPPSGRERRWSLSSYWTRVLMDEPPRHGSQIRLVSQGEEVIVGSFLAPKERGRFAAKLRAALAAAREERFEPGIGGADEGRKVRAAEGGDSR